jgi:hypothetical protein
MASNHSISRSLRRLAPAVLIIAAAVACGPFRRGPGQPPALLIFTNESLDQANVYAAAPGLGTRRIGTVMAGRTDTLAVPAELANRANLNIVARLPGRSAAAQTGPVAIRPGEQYRVRLPLDARLLSFLPAPP